MLLLEVNQGFWFIMMMVAGFWAFFVIVWIIGLGWFWKEERSFSASPSWTTVFFLWLVSVFGFLRFNRHVFLSISLFHAYQNWFFWVHFLGIIMAFRLRFSWVQFWCVIICWSILSSSITICNLEKSRINNSSLIIWCWLRSQSCFCFDLAAYSNWHLAISATVQLEWSIGFWLQLWIHKASFDLTVFDY